MRNAFAREITNLAVEHQNLVLLTVDIGNRLFDEFKEIEIHYSAGKCQ